jgi:hypothetical protein
MDLRLVHDLHSYAITVPIYNVHIFQNNQVPSGPRIRKRTESFYFLLFSKIISRGESDVLILITVIDESL